MSSAAQKTSLTPEEYLASERLAEFKSEFYDGHIYAMAGTSYRHNLIEGNLFGALHLQLKGTSCRPIISDVRLRAEAGSTYTYPDLMVVCGEPQFADKAFDTILNPVVIIEVLSPSTELWDRVGKFEKYRSLETLQEYVLVAQERSLVERYARQGDEWVLRTWKEPEEILSLGSIGCAVALSDIYASVSFAQGGELPGS